MRTCLRLRTLRAGPVPLKRDDDQRCSSDCYRDTEAPARCRGQRVGMIEYVGPGGHANGVSVHTKLSCAQPTPPARMLHDPRPAFCCHSARRWASEASAVSRLNACYCRPAEQRQQQYRQYAGEPGCRCPRRYFGHCHLCLWRERNERTHRSSRPRRRLMIPAREPLATRQRGVARANHNNDPTAADWSRRQGPRHHQRCQLVGWRRLPPARSRGRPAKQSNGHRPHAGAAVCAPAANAIRAVPRSTDRRAARTRHGPKVWSSGGKSTPPSGEQSCERQIDCNLAQQGTRVTPSNAYCGSVANNNAIPVTRRRPACRRPLLPECNAAIQHHHRPQARRTGPD